MLRSSSAAACVTYISAAFPRDVHRRPARGGAKAFSTHHDVGARFGTVGVIPPEAARTRPGRRVTTFRKDLGYQDGRRPTQVSFGAPIEEDLARRDFTMNARGVESRRRRGGRSLPRSLRY